ncbi:MAG: gliding motility-associated C-terminal domain-containing protein [Bacteroidales bacterium]
MKKILICLVIFISDVSLVSATHNRAGEITYRHISGLTYEFTITTYTYSLSPANRSELTIEWGDNTSSVAKLYIAPVKLPDFYQMNVYKATHTFPGPGIYEILMQDPNRNLGVQNIPNSVNVVFSLKTTFIINSFIGNNNSPVLLNPPKDRAALGHIFIHNPSAYDLDGDSLSYKLTICTEQNGAPIANYEFPASSDTLYVNALNGDLVWDAPVDTGTYNIAMNVEEWRKGIKIGSIVRDMQIDVYQTDNNPPVNPETMTFCVEAGDEIEFSLTTTDADNDLVKQQMTGGPLIHPEDSATFIIDSSGRGFSSSTFRWKTNCNHVRRLPYQLVLKSEDINAEISLVDIDNYYVTVIAPPPTGLSTSSTSTNITFSWDASTCAKATGYAVYRRAGRYEFTHDSCQFGVPDTTGYQRIAVVAGRNVTSFEDGNDAEGLLQGIEYCYLVTALFADGAESFAPQPVCASLIPGLPALTNVSVTEDDTENGEIFVSWARPVDLDTIAAPGPYVVKIYRSGSIDIVPQPIDSFFTGTLADTTYFDKQINTLKYPYVYSVKIFNNTPGNRFEIGEGSTEVASSLYIAIEPGDNRLKLNFMKKVPWVNTQYNVYKQNPLTLGFDSIGSTSNSFYIDSLLANGTEYCYRVISKGWRPFDSLIFFNSNVSHINCGTPQDITPPCPPVLSVQALCDSSTNILTWTNPDNYCSDDVLRYQIYYAMMLNVPFDSLTSTFRAIDTVYSHVIPDNLQLAGCYYVVAFDSVENQSPPSNIVCLDECYLYDLPNVFTPNSDDINSYFMAYNRNNAVKKIDLKIFNRWGQLVYKNTDPNFRWDGKILSSDKIVTPGIYYYLCDVEEPRLTGIYIRNLTGFVYVFTNEAPQTIPKPE